MEALTLHYEKEDLAPNERLDMLEASRWSRDIPFPVLRKMVLFMGVYKLKVGGTLFSQGDRSQFVVVIMSGEVTVYKEDAKGTPCKIAVLGANRVLGEMSLIDGQARSATVRATKSCRVLVLTSHALEQMRENAPRAWGSVIQKIALSMSQKLRATSGKLVDYR